MTTKPFDYCWKLQVQSTPNGSQTLSKMPNRYVNGIYPKLLHHGHGGRVWALEDGKEYVDLISGLGAISVGYGNPRINEAIIDQLQYGIIFSLPNFLEHRVADKLNQLIGWTEQWKFLKTGTEATTAAVKAARAITGRNRVMTCGYHGWNDWYAIQNDRKAGIPEFNQRLVTKAKYNDLNSFKPVLDSTYACVIIEPMVYDYPEREFLEKIKLWSQESGTLLIFDEVVTGGRMYKFTASQEFNIQPDFIVMSKALANGLPLSAIGGKKEIMSVFERDDFFVSGTFGGECVSLAACLETADILKKKLPNTYNNGILIKEEFRRLFGGTGAICKGYPTRLTFDFPTSEHKALWMQTMCLNGVLTGYSNMVMADHTDKDIEQILHAIEATYTAMMIHWNNPKGALKGEMPVETFRLR